MENKNQNAVQDEQDQQHRNKMRGQDEQEETQMQKQDEKPAI